MLVAGEVVEDVAVDYGGFAGGLVADEDDFAFELIGLHGRVGLGM